MMQNPVYSREMKVSSRSIRLPLIIVLFNGILSMVTLLNMYSAVAQVESTAVIQYSSFMDMYEFVTTIEFILLMFIVPAVTAASISGERERQTLELMLTTQMTASQVVIGKLMSALSTLLLLIVSSFPAVAMVFVYGGITWQDILSLLMSLSPLTRRMSVCWPWRITSRKLPCASSGFSTGKNGRRPAGNNSPPCNRKNWIHLFDNQKR